MFFFNLYADNTQRSSDFIETNTIFFIYEIIFILRIFL